MKDSDRRRKRYPGEPGIVVRYTGSSATAPDAHERITRNEIARRLAILKGYEFASDFDPARAYGRPLYFVPDETLVGIEAARQLGIHNEHDLFGGVVPHSFVATKTITHPLVNSAECVPEGWSHDLSSRLKEAVLFGITAFSREDARKAGMQVLERGTARLKPADGIGGRGQVVISDVLELEAAIASLSGSELGRSGVVIEQNFADIVTHSVGQVRVGELVASYYGLQSLTRDNFGVTVYGGSSLVVSRGDYDALLELDVPASARTAINKARVYESAVAELFPQWIASRRNYDVAEVKDAEGRSQFGVLEQSWRVGGASAAEIAALERFQTEPSVSAVRASTKEIYGAAEVPDGAIVYFHGVDDRLGPMAKYSIIEAYGDPD